MCIKMNRKGSGVRLKLRQKCTEVPLGKMMENRLQSALEGPFGHSMGIVAGSVPSLFHPMKAAMMRREVSGETNSGIEVWLRYE